MKNNEDVKYKHSFYPISAPDSVNMLPGDAIDLLFEESNNLQDIDQMVILYHNKDNDSLNMYKIANNNLSEVLGLLEWAKIRTHVMIMDEIDEEFYDEEEEFIDE